MSSPGDVSLHSPETTGTVNDRPRPLNDRKQGFGIGKRMGHPGGEDSDRGTNADEDTTWEPNPLPLMAKHPPRVTASNTKMQPDQEGLLSQTCPKGENELGWVQLQQKSLL